MNTNKRYSAEIRERTVRLVLEQQGEYASNWAAICSIADKIGCTPETLRTWCKAAKTPRQRFWPEDRTRALKQLERVNRELKRANEILHKAAAFFVQAEFERNHK